MYEHPYQPCDEPAGSNSTALQHGKVLADDGHVTLVEISEGTPRGFAFEPSGNHLAHVASLLDRNLGNTGQRPPVLTRGSHIAHSEYTVDARDHQEAIDWESSGPIGRHTERLHDRRRRDACRPQDGRAWDPLFSGDDALLVDLLDLCSRYNFDAELLKSPGGFPGQGFGECGQNTIAAFE